MKLAVPIALAVLVGFAGVTMLRGRVAPTPGVFREGSTLATAIDRAAAEGKPVLALVTADWCPPCQQLKRETLTDPAVAAWIEANTVPVYIDSDKNPDDARSLLVTSLPTTLLLRDGEIIGTRVGYAGAEDYLRFLKDTAE